MKRTPFRFLLAVVGLLGVSVRAQEPAGAPVPANLQLFLLIGQSNMAGRGKVEEQDKVTDPRIFMLTKNLRWVPAKDPVHFDKDIAGVGLCSEFARRRIARDPAHPIGLIPCAMGGTSLDEWAVGGKLYTQAVARTRTAMKQGALTGILWHQGEADSATNKVATYANRFAVMIASLRRDLNAENVPVVVGELGRFRPASAAFNAMLPSVTNRVPRCACVTAEGLADKGDKLHFGSAALRTFGARYEAAFDRLATTARTDR